MVDLNYFVEVRLQSDPSRRVFIPVDIRLPRLASGTDIIDEITRALSGFREPYEVLGISLLKQV